MLERTQQTKDLNVGTNPLEWDDELELKAQDYAENIKSQNKKIAAWARPAKQILRIEWKFGMVFQTVVS